MRKFYDSWVRLDFDCGPEEPEARGYEALWVIGACVAAVGACGIDSERWLAPLLMIAAGAGLAAAGIWRWKHAEAGC